MVTKWTLRLTQKQKTTSAQSKAQNKRPAQKRRRMFPLSLSTRMIRSLETGAAQLVEETFKNVIEFSHRTHSHSQKKSVNYFFSFPVRCQRNGSWTLAHLVLNTSTEQDEQAIHTSIKLPESAKKVTHGKAKNKVVFPSSSLVNQRKQFHFGRNIHVVSEKHAKNSWLKVVDFRWLCSKFICV